MSDVSPEWLQQKIIERNLERAHRRGRARRVRNLVSYTIAIGGTLAFGVGAALDIAALRWGGWSVVMIYLVGNWLRWWSSP